MTLSRLFAKLSGILRGSWMWCCSRKAALLTACWKATTRLSVPLAAPFISSAACPGVGRQGECQAGQDGCVEALRKTVEGHGLFQWRAGSNEAFATPVCKLRATCQVLDGEGICLQPGDPP
ncbi:MAG: hypothetical protein EOO78_06000 [Oxalobacteraceae bacterium]|nr:MAG: hypothetical protein EOO78_06000 [Oxalobacteraceae bacterium]